LDTDRLAYRRRLWLAFVVIPIAVIISPAVLVAILVAIGYSHWEDYIDGRFPNYSSRDKDCIWGVMRGSDKDGE